MNVEHEVERLERYQVTGPVVNVYQFKVAGTTFYVEDGPVVAEAVRYLRDSLEARRPVREVLDQMLAYSLRARR